MRTRWPVILLVSIGLLSGCRDDSDKPRPLPEPNPEEFGSFLDEPSGVAPSPFQPTSVEVWLTVASNPVASVAALHRLTGTKRVWPAVDQSPLTAFLKEHRLWYAELGALRAFQARKAAGQTATPPLGVAPKPETTGTGGATFSSFDAVQRQELVKLNRDGARGYLILWYPLLAVRKRLVGGGRAGVWRGITRLRELLNGTGPPLGGTPVFIRAAVAAVDAQSYQSKPPDGFRSIVGLDSYLPDGSEPRAGIIRGLGGAARPTRGEALPEAWRVRFQSPEGAPIAWLVPENTGALESGFDVAVEALVPLVKRGGKAWILIALPLAEEHKPERF